MQLQKAQIDGKPDRQKCCKRHKRARGNVSKHFPPFTFVLQHGLFHMGSNPCKNRVNLFFDCSLPAEGDRDNRKFCRSSYVAQSMVKHRPTYANVGMLAN